MDGGAWWAAVHGVAKSQTWLSDFTFTLHFHALEKEMATHPSVLAWRILGMGSHRVGHDWSDLAVAVVVAGDFLHSSAGEESACNAGDLGSIPRLGRSPGEGKGYPPQYSGLENSKDCMAHGVTNSQTRLSNLDFHFQRTYCSNNRPHFLRCKYMPGPVINTIPYWLTLPPLEAYEPEGDTDELGDGE